MNSAPTLPPRKLPVLDNDSGFFWTGGAHGQLLIQQCSDCGHWQHPPLPRCTACHGEHVAPQPVSGRGTVVSFTINRQAWLPGLEQPFVFAAIALAEQPQLYVLSNILCPVDAVRIGMAVEVEFEQQEDVFIPLFRPIGGEGYDHA